MTLAALHERDRRRADPRILVHHRVAVGRRLGEVLLALGLQRHDLGADRLEDRALDRVSP